MTEELDMSTEDITGKVSGRLTAIERRGVNAQKRPLWLCECSCGNQKIVEESKLKSGHTRSCGCLKKEAISKVNVTHRLSKAAEYKIWKGIRTRCFNKEVKSFKNYGGRGITVDERWSSFEAFFSDMGPRPSPEHSIERINNEGNYGPENCRWANVKEQANNRRSSHFITFNGITLTVTQWGEKLGFRNGTLSRRLMLGWPVEKALTTPVRKPK